MEYAGPDGGFRIKFNDKADEDLSEDVSFALNVSSIGSGACRRTTQMIPPV